MRRIATWLGGAVIAGAIAYYTIPEEMPVQAPGQYYLIVYPVALQDEIDALGIVSKGWRQHPDGTLRLTNKDGNIPMDSLEIVRLSAIDDIIFVPSDKIGEYLTENGWIVGDGL